MAAYSEKSSTPVKERVIGAEIEAIHTSERVPGHPGYYEKDGLRTYGDDEDHDHEPPVRCLLCHSRQLLTVGADDLQKDDVFDRYGIPLDRLPNSPLPFWYEQSLTLHYRRIGADSAPRRHPTLDIPVFQSH